MDHKSSLTQPVYNFGLKLGQSLPLKDIEGSGSVVRLFVPRQKILSILGPALAHLLMIPISDKN